MPTIHVCEAEEFLVRVTLVLVFETDTNNVVPFSVLSALMEEKLKNPPVKTGLITMSGDLKVSHKENDAFLSEPLSQCKSGEITMLLGHPESWLTSTAEEITESLKNQGLVIGTFLDEFQMNLENH